MFEINDIPIIFSIIAAIYTLERIYSSPSWKKRNNQKNMEKTENAVV